MYSCPVLIIYKGSDSDDLIYRTDDVSSLETRLASCSGLSLGPHLQVESNATYTVQFEAKTLR